MANTEDIQWKILQENVRIKTLARDNERGLQMSIMDLGNNVKRPPHLHPDIEWVYVLRGSFSDENGVYEHVLRGSFSDENGVYEQGDFLANKKGSKHTLVVGPDGCEIVLVWSGSVKNVDN
tara:strand:- start:274 stop:636 length:363 start_codon:yes stop_codon:yes gene_type:complete